MKHFIAIVLLNALTVHLFYSSGYLLDYYVNSEVYLANCVNKAYPEMNCNGQCVLAEKIKAAVQGSNSDKHQASIPANFEYLFVDYPFTSEVTISELTSDNTQWVSDYHYLYGLVTFHPPNFYTTPQGRDLDC